MLHKITFRVSEKELKKKKILDFFENIIFKKKNKNWKIQIITMNYLKDLIFLNLFFKFIKKPCVEILKNKNWVLSTKQNDKPVKTNFFTISQNQLNNISTKYFLLIPASTAFGTGKHSSTLLAIKNIEWLSKKKKISNFLDLGTGTGILSFVLVKIYQKNVVATDIDIESEKCVKLNKSLNSINNVFFVKCCGFNSPFFKRKKFDLIVSNILLLPLKENVVKFCQYLNEGGFVIVSGILKSQINDIVIHYGKLNLKLIKYNYINEWASIIFKKYDKKYKKN